MRKIVMSLTSAVSIMVMVVFSVVVYYNMTLPNQYYVTEDSSLHLNRHFEIIAEKKMHKSVKGQVSKSLQPSDTTELKLLGIFPIKEVSVKTVERPMLIPGGSPFGIKMLTEGVVVIGIADVDSEDGYLCPAREAGIQVGDIILDIDGQEVESNDDIASIIEKSQGGKVEVSLKRNDKKLTVFLKPILSSSNKCYKVGIWVRDSSAGIGTVTYYDPKNSTFGGLGHPVCDVDTGEILPLMSGEVVAVNVSGATKGLVGEPGELIGSFVSKTAIGKLLINNETGVFGTLNSAPTSFEPMPMVMKQDVEIGAAKILVTTEGNQPKEYDIEIERIQFRDKNATKNLVIRVVDPALLAKTGGIVQGMSGSPIIQNGAIVGAVTHVFVNNPEKGYGIFCENMYNFTQNIENEAA